MIPAHLRHQFGVGKAPALRLARWQSRAHYTLKVSGRQRHEDKGQCQLHDPPIRPGLGGTSGGCLPSPLPVGTTQVGNALVSVVARCLVDAGDLEVGRGVILL